MKKILGSLLLLLLPLFAEIKYNLFVSKSELFIKEPLLVTLHIEKEDKKIYNFEFSVLKNKKCEVRFLNKLSNANKVDISYLIYCLKEGEKKIEFYFRSKEVTDESLSDTFVGSADEQIKYIDWKIKEIKLDPLKIFIKKTPKAALYGDYTIKREIDKTKASSFEPIYLFYTIKGVGYPPKNLDFTPNIKGVKVLKDKPKISKKLTKEGVKYEARFQYALIAQRDFMIKRAKIEVFDYKKLKEIRLKPIKISLKKPQKIKLIDKENFPKKIEPFFEKIKAFFGYLIIFLAGFMSAKLIKFKKRDEVFEKKIIDAKNEKELLKILILNEEKRWGKYIKILDDAIYRKTKADLRGIKKEILKELR